MTADKTHPHIVLILRGDTDAYLDWKGIDVKIKAISILDADLERQVCKRGLTKTKAAEVEHAIRQHLDVELNDYLEIASGHMFH